MRIRHIAAAAVLAAAVLALTTCSNPVDLVEAATVEVMKANDRYLEVVSTTPVNNEQSASPTGKILVVVDRDLDMETVTTATVEYYNESTDTVVAWTPSYNSAAKTLTIQADSYLVENNLFTLTVSGLRGLDGSTMLGDFSIGFKAGAGPAGTVTLTGSGDPGYTNTTSVNVTVSGNGYATGFYASQSPSAIMDPSSIASGDWTAIGSPKPISLASIEGTQTVYVILRGEVSSEMAYSAVYESSIVLDTTSPVVNIGSDIFAYSPTSLGIGYGATVIEANIKSYSWTRVTGNTVTFGSSDASSSTVTGSTDGNTTIRLRVYDKAGHSAYDDLVFTWDNTPTLTPTLTGTESPTFNLTPTWSWSANGSGGGGVFYYQMNSTSGSWTSTTDTSFTFPVAQDDGLYTMYVYQHDSSLGYDTAYGSRSIRITSVLPYDGQTRVSRSPTVSWRSAGIGYIYKIQVQSGSKWIDVVSGLTSTSYSWGPLSATTTYIWRVVGTWKTLTKYLPSEAGARFTTWL